MVQHACNYQQERQMAKCSPSFGGPLNSTLYLLLLAKAGSCAMLLIIHIKVFKLIKILFIATET